jgi:hypothetical protein
VSDPRHIAGIPAGEDLPRDPDMDDVPEDLQLLAGLGPTVTLTTEDGVGPATLVIVPGLFGHARRLQDGELD